MLSLQQQQQQGQSSSKASVTRNSSQSRLDQTPTATYEHSRATANSNSSTASLTVEGGGATAFSSKWKNISRKSSLAVDDGVSVDSTKKSDGDLASSRRASSTLSLEHKIQQIAQQQEETTNNEKPSQSAIKRTETGIRAAIPFMPPKFAIACLVLNIIFPGVGTMVSAFSFFCGGGVPQVDTNKEELSTLFCTNMFVGLSQMMTVTFLLVGWFWSIAWGINMVTMAVKYKNEQKDQKEHQTTVNAAAAFMSNLGQTMVPI